MANRTSNKRVKAMICQTLKSKMDDIYPGFSFKFIGHICGFSYLCQSVNSSSWMFANGFSLTSLTAEQMKPA